MKKFTKNFIALFIVTITVCSCFIIPAEAARKSCGYVINVYDGGKNYSGQYACDFHSDFGKVGLFGKKVKIEFVNSYSQLSKDQVNFYKKYARFHVYVSSNGIVKKYYGNKKIGDTFKIPNGKNMSVWINSGIDSSGWKQFEKQMKTGLPWSFAQYRLKY